MRGPTVRVLFAATLVALGVALGGGCDWFSDTVVPNLPPETTMVTCPGQVDAGTPVTIEWSGSDTDGQVAAYAWFLDGSENGYTTETSAVFDSLEAGEHSFTVAAVDDDADADPTPATCDFVVLDEAVNLPPGTTIVSCPGDVTAGDDVTIEWTGSDIDGVVVSYLWVLDGGLEMATTDTSLLLEDVAAGAHAFTVAAVDDDGDPDPTPAVCSFTAAEAGSPVGRVVLAELLTTRVCVNCPNAEEGLGIMLDEYGPDSLCVIAYHDVIGPDPLATAETVARIDWYTEANGALEDNWPAVLFDGDHSRPVLGAVTGELAAEAYRFEIEEKRQTPSPFSVAVRGSIDGVRGSVTVRVRAHDEPPGGALVLRTVLVEDEVPVASRLYEFVARDILDDAPLALSAVGDSAVVTRTFSIDPAWVVGNMDVIAFVQDDATREVIQAGRLGGR